MDVHDYLNRKFWEWQDGDRTKRVLDFAKYLDVEYGTLDNWMIGSRKPNRENVKKLAQKLGQGIYEVTGYSIPDPHLSRLSKVWHLVKESTKEYVTELVEREAGQGGQETETSERVVDKP